MGVYIKGMEKPKACKECEWVAWSNLRQTDVCSIVYDDGWLDKPIKNVNEVADFCPIEEVDFVRCKDCKYYKPSELIKCDMTCTYRLDTYYTEADRYCSYAERRE